MRSVRAWREESREPQALVAKLREGERWLDGLSSGIDTSAAFYQIDPSDRRKPRYCFLVANPYPEVLLSPFSFRLPYENAEFYIVDNVEKISDWTVHSVSQMLEKGDVDLVVVMGVVGAPPRFDPSESESWWKRFWDRFCGSGVSRRERKLLVLRERLLDISAVANRIRKRLRSGGLQRRVVEALYDPKVRRTSWDLARSSSHEVAVLDRYRSEIRATAAR